MDYDDKDPANVHVNVRTRPQDFLGSNNEVYTPEVAPKLSSNNSRSRRPFGPPRLIVRPHAIRLCRNRAGAPAGQPILDVLVIGTEYILSVRRYARNTWTAVPIKPTSTFEAYVASNNTVFGGPIEIVCPAHTVEASTPTVQYEVIDADETLVAVAALRQARRYARNTSINVPSDPHTVTTSGLYERYSLPQTCGGGTLRRRLTLNASLKRTLAEASETDSDTDGGPYDTQSRQAQSRQARKRVYTKRHLEVVCPSADEIFLSVERELGLAEPSAFYSPSGWCRPPDHHPDLAAWLLSHPLDAEHSQQDRRVVEDSNRAAVFREALATNAPTEVCCVCSCMVCKSVCRNMPLSSVPGLELLRADIPPSDEIPRSCHTTYVHNGVRYILQPDAVSMNFGIAMAQICTTCFNSLNGCHAKVPKASLAAIDPGAPPPTLPSLTVMESIIIAPTRLICHVLTLTPGRSQESHPERTEDSEGHKVEWTTASTGHTVTFRNPGPDAFLTTFPMDPNDIPNIFKVRFMICKESLGYVFFPIF